MSRSNIIGPTYSNNPSSKNKILAADGVLGCIIMLSYFAGGKNIFPAGINPLQYLTDTGLEFKCIKTDVDLLTSLISEVSIKINREIGQIQYGSLPVYLSALRNGQRPNNQGEFPAVNSSFKKKTGELTVFPRNYSTDVKSGIINSIPEWIRVFVKD